MGERKDGEFIQQSLLLAGFFAGHINQGDLSIISNGAGLADRSPLPSLLSRPLASRRFHDEFFKGLRFRRKSLDSEDSTFLMAPSPLPALRSEHGKRESTATCHARQFFSPFGRLLPSYLSSSTSALLSGEGREHRFLAKREKSFPPLLRPTHSQIPRKGKLLHFFRTHTHLDDSFNDTRKLPKAKAPSRRA